MAWCRLACQAPDVLASCCSGLGHGFLHPVDIGREGGDGARDRRIRGHPAIDTGFAAQQRGVTTGITTQREADRQIQQHLRRVMPREGFAPRSQRPTQQDSQAGGLHGPGEQHPARLGHRRHRSGVDSETRIHPATLVHLGSAPSTTLIQT